MNGDGLIGLKQDCADSGAKTKIAPVQKGKFHIFKCQKIKKKKQKNMTKIDDLMIV